MAEKTLTPDRKINIEEVLTDLEHYRPRRQGWTWRRKAGDQKKGPFVYKNMSEDLLNSIPLPAAKYFDQIDVQPECVITSEIASGRFEDDIRRMRMAAWHGADHIMVIRTTGQSHFDGLIEGSPEGVGGVPITRKQIRATRKALDLIEDEVGRPINLHSYVSGVAGPEIAVMFAEEGVSGAHQDPQYNVLYRNVNMYRSFVDAAEAKKLMTGAGLVQIDGAHNVNASSRKAWQVAPELLAQHAINCAYSRAVGMPAENILLSTVPPTAPPAPCVRLDLPYALALRQLFRDFKMRAQMNTRYIESDTREATVTHVLNVLISALTSADIQSTITPDEGRNIPWHQNSIAAVETAKQALAGLDGINEYVKVDFGGSLAKEIREIKEKAVLFLEEIAARGYFGAVADGFFLDSGLYPETNGDGMARDPEGGVGAGTVVPRDADYLAPVCGHFGLNNLPAGVERACDPIGGCTLCRPEKIVYIDEMDEFDNVGQRLAATREHRGKGLLRPEVQWYGDGWVCVSLLLPCDAVTAEFAALALGDKMGLLDAEVIHRREMHPAEGTLIEMKGRLGWDIDPAQLVIPARPLVLTEEEIRRRVRENPFNVVAATVGEDEHSAGMREILDIKHGGLEKYGFRCHYLGTSVPVQKVVDAAVELNAQALLISTIITHADIHRINMKKLNGYCVEAGVRRKFILAAGGTQITNQMALDCGMDAGFGRGTKGIEVASFLVRRRDGEQDV